MRHWILGATIAAALAWAAPAGAGERTVTLYVHNMTCALCPITVKASIDKIPGVKSVVVSMEEQTATVIYDDMVTTMPEIAAGPNNAGYPAWPID